MIENNIEKKYYTIVLYGDNLAGTTTLIRKYILGTYDPDYYIYQNTYFKKNIILDNQKETTIHFWDLYHLNAYESLNRIFIEKADGIMLTYDMTNRRSFDKMQDLLNSIQFYIRNDIPIALVSCKNDLFINEQIRREEGEDFAMRNNLLFYETSAKDNYNVDFCFNDFINRIIPKDEYENNNNDNNNKINIKKERLPKKGCLK